MALECAGRNPDAATGATAGAVIKRVVAVSGNFALESQGMANFQAQGAAPFAEIEIRDGEPAAAATIDRHERPAASDADRRPRGTGAAEGARPTGAAHGARRRSHETPPHIRA